MSFEDDGSHCVKMVSLWISWKPRVRLERGDAEETGRLAVRVAFERTARETSERTRETKGRVHDVRVTGRRTAVLLHEKAQLRLSGRRGQAEDMLATGGNCGWRRSWDDGGDDFARRQRGQWRRQWRQRPLDRSFAGGPTAEQRHVRRG